MKQWQAVVLPLSLTSLMYAGSMFNKFLLLFDSWMEHTASGGGLSFHSCKCALTRFLGWLAAISSDVLTWRFYVVAPLTEELVFRACMIPLLLCGGFKPYNVMLLCPIFFSLAHLNHFMEIYIKQNYRIKKAVMIIGLQLGYTVIFGSYASFLFIRTGHLAAPLVAHIYCNFMGLPVLYSERSGIVSIGFIMGFLGFLWLLYPVTGPDLYNDRIDNCNCWQGYCSWIKMWSNGNSGGAPWWSYWSAGITNTIGPAMGIEALKYISYPAQVLAKSSKMIPVMLMGTLVYGIRYTLPEYLCTFLVAGGVSTFALLKTSSKTMSKLARPNAPLGYGLCFLNLAFDGFTNATQDSLKARYPKTSAWDIMLGMNLWGTVYNMIYMFGWPSGSGYEAVRFCQQHPEAAWDIFLYCCCGAVGQNFIFLTISRFGSLANTTITTTRKFVSIVVSSLLSGNPLSTKQWVCVSMVFSGLSYQIYLKWQKLQRLQKKRKAM